MRDQTLRRSTPQASRQAPRKEHHITGGCEEKGPRLRHRGEIWPPGCVKPKGLRRLHLRHLASHSPMPRSPRTEILTFVHLQICGVVSNSLCDAHPQGLTPYTTLQNQMRTTSVRMCKRMRKSVNHVTAGSHKQHYIILVTDGHRTLTMWSANIHNIKLHC